MLRPMSDRYSRDLVGMNQTRMTQMLVKKPTDPFPILVPIRPGVLQLKEVALCHMLSTSLQLTAQAGNIECNPSNLKSLDNAMQHALRNLDEFTARRVATW